MTIQRSRQRVRFLISDAGKMCFCVALCALLAAGVGAVVNHFLTGWMAVGGMAAIGLLYLAMGLTEVSREQSYVTASDPAEARSDDELPALEPGLVPAQGEFAAARSHLAASEKRRPATVAADA